MGRPARTSIMRVTIEGDEGSGKMTLLRAIENSFRVSGIEYGTTKITALVAAPWKKTVRKPREE